MKKATILLGAMFLLASFALACASSAGSSGTGAGAFDYRGGLPRLRGASTCGDSFFEANFEDLRALGANQLRWNLPCPYGIHPEDYPSPVAYEDWLKNLAEADKAIALSERLGMRVLLDLVTTPGDRGEGSVNLIFTDGKYRALYYEAWEFLARRYKDARAVYAFEPTNEPVPPWGTPVGDFDAVFLEVAKRIRAVDPDRVLVYDPMNWCQPYDYLDLEPLPIEGVVYTVHFYAPQSLTYQNMNATPAQAEAFGLPSYPGTFPLLSVEFEVLRRAGLLPSGADYDPGYSGAAATGCYFDAATLRTMLEPLRQFQLRTGKPVYIGEFGCFRWAPDGSAYRWLKDCVDLFEEYGWDWSFHAYRSSDCWDPEKGEVEQDRTWLAEPTDRLQLLIDAFRKNAHP